MGFLLEKLTLVVLLDPAYLYSVLTLPVRLKALSFTRTIIKNRLEEGGYVRNVLICAVQIALQCVRCVTAKQ